MKKGTRKGLETQLEPFTLPHNTTTKQWARKKEEEGTLSLLKTGGTNKRGGVCFSLLCREFLGHEESPLVGSSRFSFFLFFFFWSPLII